MNSPQVTTIELHQLVSQQQDAIVFDASNISSLADTSEAFLIFYLSKDDEQNGYGTVIQLDPETKQAAIYADLNPEYAYLFYQDEQKKLQTLLWCIEVATRTNDGLFIAHAKSFGRGITEEEIKKYSQEQAQSGQPEAGRKLVEQYTPQPRPTEQSAIGASASLGGADNTSSPAPATTSEIADPVSSPDAAPMTAATAAVSPPSTPPLQFNNEPELADQSESGPKVDELKLPPLPPKTPKPQQEDTSPQQPAQSAAQPEAPADTSDKTQPVQDLDASAAQPSDAQSNAQETETDEPPTETGDDNNQTTQPQVDAAPLLDIPDILTPIVDPQPTKQPSSSPSEPTPKRPVGRPPKQLKSDQLWPVSQQDFNWAKNMSRTAINDFKVELWQKVIRQIRTNKPGLIDDWQFHGSLEQAFQALCTTYELIPALRHDILKSLLNGRVAMNLYQQQKN